MNKLIWISVLGVTVVAGASVMIDSGPRQPAKQSEAAARQDTVFAMGRVEGATSEIALRPDVAGRIIEVLVHEGQHVEVGQVLLRLDDKQARQEVALAQAEVALGQAQLERLVNGAHQQQRAEAAALLQARMAELERVKNQWDRTRVLLESKAISVQEGDNQSALLASATKEAEAARARLELLNAPAREDEVRIDQARIQLAQARLELANVQLLHARLCAPRAGQVLKADIHPGEMAGPSSLEPAVVLADTSRFQVRAFVEELDAPRVRTGMKATLTAEGMPGRQFHGRVCRLSPRMTRKELSSDRPNERFDTKVREVWIELDDAVPLVVGLRVDARIELDAPRS
jgi:multidrug resistance efflux pump